MNHNPDLTQHAPEVRHQNAGRLHAPPPCQRTRALTLTLTQSKHAPELCHPDAGRLHAPPCQRTRALTLTFTLALTLAQSKHAPEARHPDAGRLHAPPSQRAEHRDRLQRAILVAHAVGGGAGEGLRGEGGGRVWGVCARMPPSVCVCVCVRVREALVDARRHGREMGGRGGCACTFLRVVECASSPLTLFFKRAARPWEQARPAP